MARSWSREARPGSGEPARSTWIAWASRSLPACARRRTGSDSEAEASERLEPLILDVTDAEDISRAAERVSEATEARLAGLVNNAGIGVGGPLELLSVSDFRHQIEVNLIGQVAVTQAFIPALRRARGRLVFISSIGGLIATPYMSPYHASKFGIEAVGDVLRRELRQFGVQVSIVEPGSSCDPDLGQGQDDGTGGPRQPVGRGPGAVRRVARAHRGDAGADRRARRAAREGCQGRRPRPDGEEAPNALSGRRRRQGDGNPHEAASRSAPRSPRGPGDRSITHASQRPQRVRDWGLYAYPIAHSGEGARLPRTGVQGGVLRLCRAAGCRCPLCTSINCEGTERVLVGHLLMSKRGAGRAPRFTFPAVARRRSRPGAGAGRRAEARASRPARRRSRSAGGCP